MWHSAKGIIKSTSGLNDIVLHVLLGAAIFIVLAIALRRPLLAFLLTTIIQIANELADLIEDATGTGVAGSLADIVWTMIIPVVLLGIWALRSRFRRPIRDRSNR